MKFYFPDAQDVIYPAYDFINDEYPAHRVRQRDDLYAHEALDPMPYDGMLVSKAIIDGVGSSVGKYSQAQRERLYRRGARKFFRLPKELSLLGDNGAFSYIKEHVPPVTVNEVIDFYEACGCDSGISIDHLILDFEMNATLFDANPEWIRRRKITLEFAAKFKDEVDKRKIPLEPMGAAQGWSPESYADSVVELQDMGYRSIALGGMVALRTPAILATLDAVKPVLKPDANLHLLGVARPEVMDEFAERGVTSFDSTSPFRAAFMDDRKNYHTRESAYVALRVPQVQGNPRLKRRILAGEISQREAMTLEQECLRVMRALDIGQASNSDALQALAAYEKLTEPSKPSFVPFYERTLADAPWRNCECTLCRQHGIELVIFRGSERNKRRGFHNLYVLGNKVPGRTIRRRTS
jgi:hypothetical protein